MALPRCKGLARAAISRQCGSSALLASIAHRTSGRAVASSASVSTVPRGLAVVREVRPTTGGHAAAWIKESLSAYYSSRRQEHEYRSHAAWSLRQMDDSFSLLQPDQVVIDLGCFPGGWSEVAVERCLASSTTSRVIGLDKMRMDPLSHHTFVQGDVGDQALLDRLVSELGERRADLVLSDLAPQLVGLKLEDHLASMQLALHASRIMEHVLRIGGVFLLKSLYGCESQNLRMYLDTRFQTVRTIRPPASRGTYREMFHICVGFVGRPSISEEVQTRSSFSDKFEGLDLFAYRPGDRR